MNTNISGGGLYVEHDAHVVSGSRIWLACVARGRHAKGRKASSFLPSPILEIKTNRHLLFRLAYVIGLNGAATYQLWNELRAFQTSCR